MTTYRWVKVFKFLYSILYSSFRKERHVPEWETTEFYGNLYYRMTASICTSMRVLDNVVTSHQLKYEHVYTVMQDFTAAKKLILPSKPQSSDEPAAEIFVSETQFR